MSVHTIPLNDEREHVVGTDCWCEPLIQVIDPKTGIPYENGAVIIHFAADCRELVEQLTGDSIEDGKEWEIVEDE